jgi:hypothetical protein
VGPEEVVELLERLVRNAAVARADDVAVGVAARNVVADRGWGRKGEKKIGEEEEEEGSNAGGHVMNRKNVVRSPARQ